MLKPHSGISGYAGLGHIEAMLSGDGIVRQVRLSPLKKVPGEQELFEQRAPLLLVGVGAMAPAVLEAGRALAAEGAAVQVVSPRWAVPVPDALVELALGARGVLVVEDGLVDGGIGSQLRDAMDDRVEGGGPACAPPVVRVGVPRRFLATASREEILQECAMDAPGVLAAARRLAERCQ